MKKNVDWNYLNRFFKNFPLFILLFTSAYAAVPSRITYQGRLSKSGVGAAGRHTITVQFIDKDGEQTTRGPNFRCGRSRFRRFFLRTLTTSPPTPTGSTASPKCASSWGRNLNPRPILQRHPLRPRRPKRRKPRHQQSQTRRRPAISVKPFSLLSPWCTSDRQGATEHGVRSQTKLFEVWDNAAGPS
jgi:hypothetical protein